MANIAIEAEEFIANRREFEARACQMAAFRLATGFDLDSALASRGDDRARLLGRLGRLLERERLRGNRRHWSYDLNRHIALKQAMDVLSGAASCPPRRKRKRRPAAPPSEETRAW